MQCAILHYNRLVPVVIVILCCKNNAFTVAGKNGLSPIAATSPDAFFLGESSVGIGLQIALPDKQLGIVFHLTLPMGLR